MVRVGIPTQTSKGLEDRERGRQERAGKQDREGEKGKKGEPAGQGCTLRKDQTGSRIEKEKNRGQEAGQRNSERKQGPGSRTAVAKEALGQ